MVGGVPQKRQRHDFNDGPDDVKKEELNTFRYCGGTKYYDVVQEIFSHDAPMIFVIERNGRKHQALVGTKSIYSSSDDRNLLIAEVKLAEGSIFEVFGIAPVRWAETANEFTFEHEARCRLSKFNPTQDGFDLKIVKFTGDELLAEVQSKSKAAHGKLRLNKQSGNWKLVNQTGVFSSVACKL